MNHDLYISSVVWDQKPRVVHAGVPHHGVPLEEPQQIVLSDHFALLVEMALTSNAAQ